MRKAMCSMNVNLGVPCAEGYVFYEHHVLRNLSFSCTTFLNSIIIHLKFDDTCIVVVHEIFEVMFPMFPVYTYDPLFNYRHWVFKA